MSGQGFHVHGPHDHALEHAAHGDDHGDGSSAHHGIGGGSLTSQIALLTKRKWLEWGMFTAGGIGVIIGILAMLHI